MNNYICECGGCIDDTVSNYGYEYLSSIRRESYGDNEDMLILFQSHASLDDFEWLHRYDNLVLVKRKDE